MFGDCVVKDADCVLCSSRLQSLIPEHTSVFNTGFLAMVAQVYPSETM